MALSGPDNWGLMPPVKRRKPWWDKSPSGSYYYPSRPSMSNLPPLGDMPGFAQAQTPQTSGAGGKSMTQRIMEKMAEMEVPEHAGFDSPSPWGGKTQWGPQNFAHSPVGSLMNMTVDPNDPRKRKGPY